MTSTSMSFAPPPRLTSTGSFSFALSNISCLWVRIVNLADAGSETSVTCICPIIIGSVELAWNPPFCRAIFAALLAAATTDGSSIAIGIKWSLPLITKFTAIPTGKGMVPTTFSIILSAISPSAPVLPSTFSSSSVRFAKSFNCSNRSFTLSL